MRNSTFIKALAVGLFVMAFLYIRPDLMTQVAALANEETEESSAESVEAETDTPLVGSGTGEISSSSPSILR